MLSPAPARAGSVTIPRKVARIASTVIHETTLLLTLSGEFDLSGASSLRTTVRAAEGQRQVILDLSGVTWLDSSTLAVIVRTYEAVNERGGTLGLVRPRPHLWEIFELTGLAHIPSFPTRESALAGGELGGGP